MGETTYGKNGRDTAYVPKKIDRKNLLKERKSLETRMAEKTGELELRLKAASLSVTGLKDKISSFENTLKNRKLELIIDRGTKEEKTYISEAISSSYITQIGDEIVNYLKKHLGVAERQLKNEFELIARLFTTICKLNVQVFKGDADARPFDIFLEKNREKSLSSYPKSSSKEMHFNEANAIPSKNLQKITVQNTDALSRKEDDGNAKVIEIGEGDGKDDDSPSVVASFPAADIEESENASNLVQNLPRIDEEASSSDESQNLPGIDEEASSSDESIIREGAERSTNMASNSQHKEQDIKNQFNGDIHRHVSEVLVEQLDEVGKLSGTESSSNLDESIAREDERPTSNSQHKEQDIKNQINHDIHRHVSEFLVEQLDEVGKLFGTVPQHNPRGHLRDIEDPHNLHDGKAEKTLGLSDIISSVPDFMRDHPMGHLKHIDDAHKLHRHSVRAEQALGLNDIIGSVADFGRDEHINVKLDQDGNDRSGSGTNETIVSDVKPAKRVSFLETQGTQASVDGDEGNQPAVERPEMIETSIMMNNTVEEDDSTQDIHSSDDDETDTTAEELGQNMPKDGDSQIVQAQEKCKQLHLEIIDLQKKKESVSHLIKELDMGIIEKGQILKKTEKRVKKMLKRKTKRPSVFKRMLKSLSRKR